MRRTGPTDGEGIPKSGGKQGEREGEKDGRFENQTGHKKGSAPALRSQKNKGIASLVRPTRTKEEEEAEEEEQALGTAAGKADRSGQIHQRAAEYKTQS